MERIDRKFFCNHSLSMIIRDWQALLTQCSLALSGGGSLYPCPQVVSSFLLFDIYIVCFLKKKKLYGKEKPHVWLPSPSIIVEGKDLREAFWNYLSNNCLYFRTNILLKHLQLLLKSCTCTLVYTVLFSHTSSFYIVKLKIHFLVNIDS